MQGVSLKLHAYFFFMSIQFFKSMYSHKLLISLDHDTAFFIIAHHADCLQALWYTFSKVYFLCKWNHDSFVLWFSLSLYRSLLSRRQWVSGLNGNYSWMDSSWMFRHNDTYQYCHHDYWNRQCYPKALSKTKNED